MTPCLFGVLAAQDFRVLLGAPNPLKLTGIGYEPVGVRHAARFGASG